MRMVENEGWGFLEGRKGKEKWKEKIELKMKRKLMVMVMVKINWWKKKWGLWWRLHK